MPVWPGIRLSGGAGCSGSLSFARDARRVLAGVLCAAPVALGVAAAASASVAGSDADVIVLRSLNPAWHENSAAGTRSCYDMLAFCTGPRRRVSFREMENSHVTPQGGPTGSAPSTRHQLFVPNSAAFALAQIDPGRKMRWSQLAPQNCTRRYLDTFDRLLTRRAVVLEAVQTGGAVRLRWLSDSGALRFECPVDGAPRFAGDVPAPAFRAALERLTGVRALLVTGLESGKLSSASLLDRRDKIVLRIELWTPGNRRRRVQESGSARGPYIHLLPLRGFGKALDSIRNEVARTGRAVSLHRVLALESAAAPGSRRAPQETLDGQMRADAGFKQVLLEIARSLEDLHPAVLADFDTECLHDFRVALRRSRSLLARADGLLPLGVFRRFGAGFAWLSGVTGPVRDLDVYVLELERRAAARESFACAMLPAVVAERSRRFEKMAAALRSVRYRRLITAWARFLESPGPARTRLRDARRPLIDVAGERVYAGYRKLVRDGRTVEAGTPIERIHEVRKAAKKVRYLIEPFGDLWKQGTIRETTRRLKRFQGYLGELQDLCVQAELLRPFSSPSAASSSGDVVSVDAVCANTGEEIQRLEARVTKLKAKFMRRFAAFDEKRRHRALKKVLAIGTDSDSG